MEENNNENRTDYEPNFILKDPEPIAENPSFVTADTIQDDGLSDIFSEEELRGAGINVEEVLGKDVREEQINAQAYGGEDGQVPRLLRQCRAYARDDCQGAGMVR